MVKKGKKMKKALIALIGAACILLANDPVLTQLSTLNIIKDNQITILKVQDEGNVYLIKGESAKVPPGQANKKIDFYITKDKKILLMGNGIYTDSGEKVGFPLDKSVLEGKEAFSYGSGSKVLYVFTDPQCPYCKKFEQLMATLKEKYTFKVYLFPLPFHAEAIPMCKWILKAKDGNQMGERLIALANDSQEYKKLVLSPAEDKQLMDIINHQLSITEAAEIRSTPTVMDANFNKINWQAL